MEAVGAFIEGCKKYGLTEKDCCVTLDIYEKQAGDQNMVRVEHTSVTSNMLTTLHHHAPGSTMNTYNNTNCIVYTLLLGYWDD